MVKKHYKRTLSAFPKLVTNSGTQNKRIINDKINCLSGEIKTLEESIQKIEERLIYGKLTTERAEQLEAAIDKQIKSKQQEIDELTRSLEDISELKPSTDIDKLTDDEKCNIVKKVLFDIHLWRDKRYYWNMDFYIDGETIEHYMIYTRNPDYYILNGEDKTKIEL